MGAFVRASMVQGEQLKFVIKYNKGSNWTPISFKDKDCFSQCLVIRNRYKKNTQWQQWLDSAEMPINSTAYSSVNLKRRESYYVTLLFLPMLITDYTILFCAICIFQQS